VLGLTLSFSRFGTSLSGLHQGTNVHGHRTRSLATTIISKYDATTNFANIADFEIMVHPGHPSKGCRTCKMRRIKCDEMRPICRKCASSKRICLGYDVPQSTTKQKAPSSTKDIQDAVLLQRKRGFEQLITRPTSIKVISCHTPLGSNNSVKQPSQFEAVHSAIQACFHSLQHDVAQTISQRKQLHNAYQSALRTLRSTMLSASTYPSVEPAMAAYSFALYEVRNTTFIPTKLH
jgi:hypothetical protein